MAASDMADAASEAMFDVETKFFNLANMATLCTNWSNALAAAGIADNANGRTVLNWVPIGRLLALNLSGQNSLLDANEVGVFVYRTCRAVEFAGLNSRITAGQEAAILASYNSIIA